MSCFVSSQNLTATFWDISTYLTCLSVNICRLNFLLDGSYMRVGSSISDSTGVYGSCYIAIDNRNHYNQFWVAQNRAVDFVNSGVIKMQGNEGGLEYCYSSDDTMCSNDRVTPTKKCDMQNTLNLWECNTNNIMQANIYTLALAINNYNSIKKGTTFVNSCLCTVDQVSINGLYRACYDVGVILNGSFNDIFNAFSQISDAYHNSGNVCEITSNIPNIGSIKLTRRVGSCY